MPTIKKKRFKNMIIESPLIDEFVTDGGGVISGDEKYNKGVDVKTGPINMPGDDKGLALTTNKHMANAIQPRNWWWSMTYGYGQGSGTGASPVASNLGETESLEESELAAEQNMKNMVEDILSKKSKNSEIVKKRWNVDVNRNNVPDIEDLSDTQMIVVGKLNDLIDSMGSTNMNGEELGITLNYFLSSIDTTQIPSDYKNIIRKQL